MYGDDVVVIRVNVSTRWVGSRDDYDLEINRDEWEEMSDLEKENLCRDIMFNMISWDYEEIC